MNIAIHIDGLGGGGAERAVTLLARDLVGLGHRVLIVTYQDAGEADYPLDVRVERVSIGQGRSRLRMLRVMVRVLRLRRAISRFNADVTLGFMTTSALYVICACAGLQMKAVCCERVAPAQQSIARLGRFLRRILFPFSAAVVCQTPGAGQWYQRRLPRTRVEVIPNAIRLPLETVPPIVPVHSVVPAGAMLVLAVGRLDPQKGFDLLIEAFCEIAERLPALQLVVLGEGALRSELAAAVAARDMGARVALPGRAGNMRQWYERADMFVLSSRFEGFPNVLLEAMAHGLPVVTTNCDYGPEDIVTDQRSGLIVPTGCPAALSAGMLKLAENENLRRDLGAQAQRAALAHDADAIARRWEHLLADLPA